MSKNKLGTKRQCPNCGAKYYDLNRNPIICPTCQHQFDQSVEDQLSDIEIEDLPEQKISEEEIKEVEGPEIITLEEADSEQMGGTATDIDSDENIGSDDSASFLSDEDDEEEDVADIVVGSDEDEDN